MTEETAAQRFVRELTQLGFDPNPGRSAEYIEYHKTYCTAEGQYVRVFLHFDKPVMGMTGLRLANITVTTQQCIAPERDDITWQCPNIARDEVLELVERLSTEIPQQAVVTRACVRCKRESPEFYVINDDAVCHQCVAERKASGPDRHRSETQRADERV